MIGLRSLFIFYFLSRKHYSFILSFGEFTNTEEQHRHGIFSAKMDILVPKSEVYATHTVLQCKGKGKGR